MILMNKNLCDEVIKLFNIGFGTRKIAKALNVSRCTVQKLFLKLGLKNTKNVSSVKFQIERKCAYCKLIKNIIQFKKYFDTIGRLYYRYCIECEPKRIKLYRISHIEQISKQEKEYRLKNKEIINYKFNEYIKIRKQTDPSFKLRKNMSTIISQTLNKNNGSKNNKSCFLFLNYSEYDLKQHIESLFEPWMTWQNYGKYNKTTWNDQDQSTWTWNIDHIIPQSDLPYSNMEDENFKKIWALDNLRPLNAKQNVLEGVNRTRHNKNGVVND